MTPWTDECPTLTLWIWPGFPFRSSVLHTEGLCHDSPGVVHLHILRSRLLQQGLKGMALWHSILARNQWQPMTALTSFRLKLTVSTSEAMLVKGKWWLLMVSDLQPKRHTWANSWPFCMFLWASRRPLGLLPGKLDTNYDFYEYEIAKVQSWALKLWRRCLCLGSDLKGKPNKSYFSVLQSIITGRQPHSHGFHCFQ